LNGTAIPILQSGPIAVLRPNGLMCGDPEGFATVNRVGASTGPALWFDEEFDGDGNQIGGFYPGGEFDYATTANINDW